jgi:hypothetical protein
MCPLVRSILKNLPNVLITPGVTTNTSEAPGATADNSPPSFSRLLEMPPTSKGAPPSTATNGGNVNKKSATASCRGSGMDYLPPSPKKPKIIPNRKDGSLEASSESEKEGSDVQKGSVPTSDNEKEDEQIVIKRKSFAANLERQGKYEAETPAVKRDNCGVKVESRDSEKEDTKPVIKTEYAVSKVESDSENSGKEEKPIIKTEDLAVKLEPGSEKEDEHIFKRESLSADESSNEDVTSDARELDADTASIGRMKLSNAARNSGIEGLATVINDNMMPSRFEEVFLLMDFLFDSEDEDSYHQRLFIRAGSRTNGSLDGLRKGMSTRQKLRKFKTKNPRHPTVSWHLAKKEWIPQTKDALEHFIRLLKYM